MKTKTRHLLLTVLILSALALPACGPAANAALKCELDAVKATIPIEDLDSLSLGDVRELRAQLHACVILGDAGK